jgi:hypothetical protein
MKTSRSTLLLLLLLLLLGERGPLSPVSTTEELFGRKSSGSSLENREHGRRDPSRWPRCTLYPQKLALPSQTSGGRSVGTVRSRTQATEFSWLLLSPLWSSGQSSWLQIRRLGFDARHYIEKIVVGLERGPLSLVSTTEELLDWKVAAPV